MATRRTTQQTVTAAVCAPSETLAGLPVAMNCGVSVLRVRSAEKLAGRVCVLLEVQ